MTRRLLPILALVVLLSVVVACADEQEPTPTPTIESPTRVATVQPLLSPAATLEPTAAPTATPGDEEKVLAESRRDLVHVFANGQPTQLPEGDERLLSLGMGVGVEESGWAVLTFPDLRALEIDVARGGTLEVAEYRRESLLLTIRDAIGMVHLDSQEPVPQRVTIETKFARIEKLGTEFIIVEEANTDLEWVIVLDSEQDDDVVVTSLSGSTSKPVPEGGARWVAPLGEAGPLVPYDRPAVEAWMDGVFADEPQPEIGWVLWPHADFEATTEPLDDLPEPGTPFALEGVTMTLTSGTYDLVDCNLDGIEDVRVQDGVLTFDFRGLLERVSVLEVEVINLAASDPGSFKVFNPAYDQIDYWDLDEARGRQIRKLDSTDPLNLPEDQEDRQPYHYAELELSEGCFVRFGIQPPGTPAQVEEGAESVEDVVEDEVPTVSPDCVRQRPEGWLSYLVREGDTLEDIARRSCTSVADLADANCVLPNLIRAGGVLYVGSCQPAEPVSSEAEEPVVSPPTDGCSPSVEISAPEDGASVPASFTVTGVVPCMPMPYGASLYLLPPQLLNATGHSGATKVASLKPSGLQSNPSTHLRQPEGSTDIPVNADGSFSTMVDLSSAPVRDLPTEQLQVTPVRVTIQMLRPVGRAVRELASDSIDVNVVPGPRPEIYTPRMNTRYNCTRRSENGDLYANVLLSGGALDLATDERLVGDSLVWTTDRADLPNQGGELGGGETVTSARLFCAAQSEAGPSETRHQITLTATDSLGQSGSASVSVVLFRELPDLTVTLPETATVPPCGERVSCPPSFVNAVVTNVGRTLALPPIAVEATVSGGEYSETMSETIQTALGANQTFPWKIELNPSCYDRYDGCQVTVRVDPGNVVLESNEGNNSDERVYAAYRPGGG